MRSLLNVLFPPRCRVCGEDTESILCSFCIDLLAPPDPVAHCRHCFVPIQLETAICPRCLLNPMLSAPKAFLFEASSLADQLYSTVVREHEEALLQTITSLAVILWSRLDWPSPHLIVPIPSKERGKVVQNLALEFSILLSCPLSHEFSLRWRAPFQWRLTRKREGLLREKNILFFDLASDTKRLGNALQELRSAQPKSIHILSVFESLHIPK